jgi:hypothetical protein
MKKNGGQAITIILTIHNALDSENLISSQLTPIGQAHRTGGLRPNTHLRMLLEQMAEETANG